MLAPRQFSNSTGFKSSLQRRQIPKFAWVILGCMVISHVFSIPIRAEDEVPTESAVATTDVSTHTLVSEILFVGNTLNKPKSLQRKIKSRVGRPLDRRQLRDDVKLLFETGDFDDVQVEVLDTSKTDSRGRNLAQVTFHVVERSVIKRIDYKGDRKIRASAFSDKIQTQEGAPYDRYKAALDERSILEYYRDEGYAQASVEHYTTIDERAKSMILTFFIVEGDRVLVKRVHVDGVETFRERTILRRIKTRRKKVYKDTVLMEDIERLTSFYKNKGHLDVEIASPVVTIDEEKNEAEIRLTIKEGPRYNVGSIEIEGSTIFTPQELRKAVTLRPGRQYALDRLNESVGNITSLYADKGYLRTEVVAEPERRPDEGLVNFQISIEESSVVYVDGVYVDGNTYTKTHVIRREVLLKQGDVFSANRMRRSVEKIYNLGFLDDVQVDVQQPRSPDLADVIFSVKEGKPGVLSAGAGFSSVDRFVGSLQVQHNNLFGLAQRVNAMYEFGARRQNFEIGWTDPWFLGYRMSGGVDLFNTRRRRDYPGNRNAYREKSRGVSFRLGPRITDDLSLLMGYTVSQNEIFDVDDNIKRDIFPTYGIPREDALDTDSVKQLKSSFVSELALDTRDNRFDATRGSRNAASIELSGGPFGGDIHYYKPQVSSAWYFPTFWKFVFTANARMAWVNSFSPSRDVPTSAGFFLGGPDTIRGYDINSIAPRVREINNLGLLEIRDVPGQIMFLSNFEYKFPIVQERNRTIFQGAFFLDVGGTWVDSNSIDFTTGAAENRLKAGVGFGFRFKTPVFPIRLDFGIPLTPRDADSNRSADSRSLQPYFTIGNIF